LIGTKHNLLTILEIEPKGKRKYFKCRCDCGSIKSVRSDSLLSHKIKSCGCLVKTSTLRGGAKRDLTGRVFGRLTVEAESGKTNNGNYKWQCKCACGNMTLVASHQLVNGRTRSCGCLRTELNSGSNSHYYTKGETGTITQVFKRYMKGAIKRQLVFDLTLEEFTSLSGADCVYCGDPPSIGCEGVVRNGVDRVDSSKGYVQGNVVSCCKTCNIMKHKFTAKQFIDKAIQVADKSKSNKEANFG